MSGCAGHPHRRGAWGRAAGGRCQKEERTRLVALLTLLTMAVELVVGAWTGSMALLADGWHMASHAGALALASAAYWFARRFHAQDRFAFGPAKVGTLAGFTNAMLLGVVALFMGIESGQRLLHPQAVRFDEALWIALVGLLVNVISARVLHPAHTEDHHDHNLRSAYAHVIADVLTSVLAIAALVAGHFTGFTRLDALAGLVGALAILWWAVGLLRTAVPELVDVCVDRDRVAAFLGERLRARPGVRLFDVRVWSTGAGRLACHLDIAAPAGELSAACRDLLEKMPAIHHLSTSVRSGSSGWWWSADLGATGGNLARSPESPREQDL
jgi:cation diffusion facilitator family transporter